MKNKFVAVVRKNLPAILTAIGIGGMWAMGVMLAKSAPETKEKVEEAEKKKGENLTVVEKAKVVVPEVWPALAMGGLSTWCLISSTRTCLRRNAVLASAYYISRNALREYKTKVVEHIGERKEQKIRDELAQDKLKSDPIKSSNLVITGQGDHLCYISPFGLYFQSDINKVRQAVNTINERLVTGGEMYVTANDFLSELGLKQIGIGDDLGWNIEHGSLQVSYSSALASDDRPCLTLDFELYPV